MLLKRLSLVIGALLLMLAIAACGTGPGSYSSSSTSTSANSSNSGSTSTSSSSNAQDLIHTATAMVGNKSETILTDAKGMTLYYFTPDTSTQTACADACAKKWPPLLAAGASA
ncbi:MAG: hypothetical protein JO215_12520, partial [Ktedonobacteraceae bacterium]|nr:hypothetical protein [Ktedonobacteraceae bacterium]